MLVTRTVDQISAPTADDRNAVLAAPVATVSFERAFAAWQCLHVLEVSRPQTASPPLAEARVVFWNAERLKYLAPSASLLERAGADILLLCEVDVGMARSGNRHTIGELSSRLGTGYAFVEFVELGLGNARERVWH